MPPKPHTPHQTRLQITLLWLLVYASATLFAPPLLDDADSVHAEVAREILLRHDWVTLHANGIRYLEKAPIFYWLQAISMKLAGVSTAASRLPLALAVLALAFLLESFARKAYASTRAGQYAALIFLSSFGIFIFTRINIPDLLVCLFLTAAVYAFHQTEQTDSPQKQPSLSPAQEAGHPERNSQGGVEGPRQSQPRRDRSDLLAASSIWPLLFATACALNLLTKGLIGIVFPIAIVLTYLLLTRGPQGTLTRLRELHPIRSLALFLTISLPWHILIALANPTVGHPGSPAYTHGHWQVPLPTDGNVHGWLWFYFANEQLYRYLNLRVPRVNFAGRPEYDTVPLWLFLGLIFIWLMPWSAFLPGAIRRAWPPRHQLRTFAPESRTDLLLLLWAAIPLLFFSLSTRQEYYVLPSLPPLILLIARYLSSSSLTTEQKLVVLSEAQRSRRTPKDTSDLNSQNLPATNLQAPRPNLPSLVLLILGTTLSLATLYFLLHTRTPAPNTDLATLLQQNPADYALSFGHFLDLNAQSLGLFRLPLALTAFAFFAGPLAHYLLRKANQNHAAVLSLVAASTLFLAAAWQGLRIFSPTLTSYQLAAKIRPQLQPTDLLILHGEYEDGSTLGFYLKRDDLHICEGRSSNLWYGSFFPDAPKIFESPQQVEQEWPGPQRIFLWQDPHDPDRQPLALPGPVYIVAAGGGKQILSNQPNH